MTTKFSLGKIRATYREEEGENDRSLLKENFMRMCKIFLFLYTRLVTIGEVDLMETFSLPKLSCPMHTTSWSLTWTLERWKSCSVIWMSSRKTFAYLFAIMAGRSFQVSIRSDRKGASPKRARNAKNRKLIRLPVFLFRFLGTIGGYRTFFMPNSEISP